MSGLETTPRRPAVCNERVQFHFQEDRQEKLQEFQDCNKMLAKQLICWSVRPDNLAMHDQQRIDLEIQKAHKEILDKIYGARCQYHWLSKKATSIT